jgi:hypothetical protein
MQLRLLGTSVTANPAQLIYANPVAFFNLLAEVT